MPPAGLARCEPAFRLLSLVACLVFGIACLFGCRHSSDDGPSSIAYSGARVLSQVSESTKIQTPSAEALALWKRTLEAARTSPGVAKVSETRFAGSGADRASAHFTVIESESQRRGQTARYRLTYETPVGLKGVVILNDGHAVWRYNGSKRLIARQTSTTAPTPPELEDGVAAVAIQSDGARPEIEGGLERVAGRVTQVLALRTARGHRIVERRWVDKETGRTMRFEQYAGRDAHIVRRVEIEEFRSLRTPADTAWAALQFAPSFPSTAHIVESGTFRTRHLAEAEDVARSAQLPLHVRGFALRSVARVPQGADEALGISSDNTLAQNRPTVEALSVHACPTCANEVQADDYHRVKTTQFYYTKGNQAISVFVASLNSQTAKNKKTEPDAGLQPKSGVVTGGGWSPASLAGDVYGFARTNGNGAAISWTGHRGDSYIAVAHMSLSELLPVIRAFAANRDDAPTTLASGH